MRNYLMSLSALIVCALCSCNRDTDPLTPGQVIIRSYYLADVGDTVGYKKLISRRGLEFDRIYPNAMHNFYVKMKGRHTEVHIVSDSIYGDSAIVLFHVRLIGTDSLADFAPGRRVALQRLHKENGDWKFD